ncbi:transposase of ISAar26, IS3 family, IS3 group, orfA [Corynebacterium halotolerans YIM 70093 = DSM 44683]|uniref:Transposase of ISAar26, IS3 family, IS3 group, orfA n=1 Tax=Corynebacterium halotolerans YIM 70093 = DSM 44683 TaxID=1121362 RepID=M1NQE6_9CORY|nr:transposase of ISAar26, IS3 family, IS3 group, orfA [Corynebacterium halotolerans YIM 70093 = DSM 44683]
MRMGHRPVRKDVYHHEHEEEVHPGVPAGSRPAVIDTGRPIAEVARELNLGATLLGRWVKKERERTGDGPAADLDADERAELDRLRRENAELKMDNEFLGKAAALLASKL